MVGKVGGVGGGELRLGGGDMRRGFLEGRFGKERGKGAEA